MCRFRRRCPARKPRPSAEFPAVLAEIPRVLNQAKPPTPFGVWPGKWISNTTSTKWTAVAGCVGRSGWAIESPASSSRPTVAARRSISPCRPTRHGRTWTTGPPTADPRRSVRNAVLGFLSDGPLLGALPAAGAGEESGTIRAPAPASRRRSLPKHPTVDRVHADRETRSASWLRLSWVPWRDCGAAAGNKIDRFGYIFPRIALAC